MCYHFLLFCLLFIRFYCLEILFRIPIPGPSIQVATSLRMYANTKKGWNYSGQYSMLTCLLRLQYQAKLVVLQVMEPKGETKVDGVRMAMGALDSVCYEPLGPPIFQVHTLDIYEL